MSHRRLRQIIVDAHNASPYISHTPIGMDEPTYQVAKPAAVSTVLGLNAEFLPSLFDQNGKLLRTPAGPIGATTIRLSTGILEASRVAAVGAHVIVQPDPSKALATGLTGVIAVQRNAAEFRTFDAATFATVADDADVALSLHPAKSSAIAWDSSISKGVRIEFKRSAQKEVGIELLSAEIIAAVVLGLARAADETLLSAINAAGPTAFTLAKAAAQGLKHGELRGLIGTAGAGGVISGDGALRAAGIGSELTADMTGTIVGAWDRAAVAIHEDIPLHFERLDLQGNLVITAWVNLIPLVPDVAKFWTVAG